MTVDRRSLLGVLGGTGGLRLSTADQALDVQLLQTSASVENVLVSTYDTILGLPLFTAPSANTVVRNVLVTARAQHIDHATACNDVATKLGGKPQTGANPALAQVATRARPNLIDLSAVTDLALQLETASLHTHQNGVALLTDLNARRLSGGIMAVEADHVGLLRVLKALAGARAPELITLDGGNGARVPADVVLAAIPDAFSKPDQGRPPGEGAIR